jgi:DDE superfamily endonuclease
LAPDGLILHLFGPIEGRRHDMTLYRESNIDDALQTSMEISGTQYYLYGDPAYCLRPYLQIGYRGSYLTIQQVQFNFAMSKVRIAVEWAFRDVKMYFTHVDVPRKLKLRITPAGLWYVCGVMLWNFRVCLYGSQTSQSLDCDSVSIEEYLSHQCR